MYIWVIKNQTTVHYVVWFFITQMSRYILFVYFTSHINNVLADVVDLENVILCQVGEWHGRGASPPASVTFHMFLKVDNTVSQFILYVIFCIFRPAFVLRLTSHLSCLRYY